jgi:hypothetical protein
MVCSFIFDIIFKNTKYDRQNDKQSANNTYLFEMGIELIKNSHKKRNKFELDVYRFA